MKRGETTLVEVLLNQAPVGMAKKQRRTPPPPFFTSVDTTCGGLKGQITT